MLRVKLEGVRMLFIQYKNIAFSSFDQQNTIDISLIWQHKHSPDTANDTVFFRDMQFEYG